MHPHLRPDPTASGMSPDLLASEVEQRVVARLEQWIASDLDERVIDLVEQRIDEETERRSWRLGTEVF